jgi:hypothetical protein
LGIEIARHLPLNESTSLEEELQSLFNDAVDYLEDSESLKGERLLGLEAL